MALTNEKKTTIKLINLLFSLTAMPVEELRRMFS